MLLKSSGRMYLRLIVLKTGEFEVDKISSLDQATYETQTKNRSKLSNCRVSKLKDWWDQFV